MVVFSVIIVVWNFLVVFQELNHICLELKGRDVIICEKVEETIQLQAQDAISH